MVLKKLSLISALAAGAVFAGQVSAANVTVSGSSETLTFGGQRDATSIDGFFDNGTTSIGLAGGVANNVGITFSSPALFVDPGSTGRNGTGSGKFENVPSGANGVLQLSGASLNVAAVMDDSAGFSGISFNYSLLGNALNPITAPTPETVSLFSGLDGTGTLLDTITLSPSSTPTACTVGTDSFCSWLAANDPSLTGTAQSAVFSSSTRGFAELDAITLDNATAPVPLPASLWLMLGGVGGLFCVSRRQRKA
jgi:hypothetical protein